MDGDNFNSFEALARIEKRLRTKAWFRIFFGTLNITALVLLGTFQEDLGIVYPNIFGASSVIFMMAWLLAAAALLFQGTLLYCFLFCTLSGIYVCFRYFGAAFMLLTDPSLNYSLIWNSFWMGIGWLLIIGGDMIVAYYYCD